MQSGERIVLEGREYRLGSVLSTGAGSYGQVWAAVDSAGRAVALKFINTEAMSQADSSLHGHWRAHLEREIEFLTSLTPAQSQHIVALLDHGQLDGQPVLVLERMQSNLGQWLAQRRRDGEPPPDLVQILDWAEQILAGLDAIHQAGFVYRDLKFSNILVSGQGALLKLADFGSLKREDGDSTRSFIGTPAAMAPEQLLPVRRSARGCEYAVDFRADYYALGLLLFTLLTERPTTAAQRRLGQLLALHGQEGVGRQYDLSGGMNQDEREQVRRAIEFWTVPARPEQAQHGVAPLLIDLLDRLLARDPAERPASGAAIRALLQQARADQPSLPPLIVPEEWSTPPDTPPNRHPRRLNASARRSGARRLVGLLGLSALAALAWAVAIRPMMVPERSDPVKTAPVASAAATPPTDLKPLVIEQPVATAPPPGETAAAAPARPEPPMAPEPSEAEAGAENIATAPPAEPPAEPAATSAAERPAEALVETRSETDSAPTSVETETASDAEIAADEAPVPEQNAPVAESGLAAEEVPASEQNAPVAESGLEINPASAAPAPSDGLPIIAPKPLRPTPGRASRLSVQSKSGAAPTRIEPNRIEKAPPSKVFSRKALAGDADQDAPIKAGSGKSNASEPSLRAPAPGGVAANVAKAASVKAATASEPAIRAPAPARLEAARTSSAPLPAKTVAATKPSPKPSAVHSQPSMDHPPTVARRPVRVAKVSPPMPPAKLVSPPVRERPAPVMTPPALRQRPSAGLAARAPSAHLIAPERRPSPMPPIELVSSAAKGAAPAQPPLELFSRARPDPDRARTRPAPAIELISRPGLAPAAPAVPAVPPVSSAGGLSAPTSSTVLSRRSVRTESRSAPDLRRQAENFGQWVSRTGASVGTEIQRGLDSANQALSGLTGTCARADGCGARPVLRRDRWSASNRSAPPR
ncbi:MAG: protein kinase [Candidatus Competibacter sp.]|jgi:serine/threonine protein kinase